MSVVRAIVAPVMSVVCAAGLVTSGCSDAGPDRDEAAVCRAVQDLVDALNEADPSAAVAAYERVRVAGSRTDNGTLSSRAIALSQEPDDVERQPAEDVNEELVSVADACGDVNRPIRGLD